MNGPWFIHSVGSAQICGRSIAWVFEIDTWLKELNEPGVLPTLRHGQIISYSLSQCSGSGVFWSKSCLDTFSQVSICQIVPYHLKDCGFMSVSLYFLLFEAHTKKYSGNESLEVYTQCEFFADGRGRSLNHWCSEFGLEWKPTSNQNKKRFMTKPWEHPQGYPPMRMSCPQHGRSSLCRTNSKSHIAWSPIHCS